MLFEFVSLTLSTLDNSWTSKKINTAIAPDLCMNISLGLPFLVHNCIVTLVAAFYIMYFVAATMAEVDQLGGCQSHDILPLYKI